MSAPARRRRRAVAALALLLVAVLAVDAVGRAVRPGVLREAAVLAVDGAAASREPPRLPEGFSQEVVPVEGFAGLRVGAGGSVVGYEVEKDPARAFDEVRSLLDERGWKAVPSGDRAGGSFVKETGRFRWAYVSCVRAGDTTSVVVQCATADEKG